MKKYYLPFLLILSLGLLNIRFVQGQITLGNNPDEAFILNEAQTYQFNAVAIPDDETYSLLMTRPGMTINATTGLISWTPASMNDGGKVIVQVANTGYTRTDTMLFYVSEGLQCDANTVAYWKLDEGGGTYLDTYGSHDAVEVGTVADAAGLVDRAAEFTYTPGSGITVPHHDDFNVAPGSSFSLSFWFNSPEKNYTLGNPPLMIGRDEGGDAQWWVGIQDNNLGALEWYLQDNDDPDFSQYLKIDVSNWDINTWHHMVCLYDASTNELRLYLDSDNTESGSDIKTLQKDLDDPFTFDVPTNLSIGCMQTQTAGPINYPFNGLIDEVIFFNKALNQAEIDDLYAKGSGGNPACSPGNSAPIFTSDPVTSVKEDSAYSYLVVAKDMDPGDDLTYSVPGGSLPSWLSFNETTHILSGTPVNADVGVSPITIRVTDEEISSPVLQQFNLTVENVNDAPQISSSPVLTVNEEQAYSYDVAADDIDDGDVLTYSLTQKPAWLSINSSTGVISGTAPLNDTGSYDVTARVTDVALAYDEQTYTLDIRNVNDAPAITGQNPDPLTVDEDNSLLIELSNIVYTDVDNDAGEITLDVLSGTNYTFTGNTITPAQDFNGALTVNIQVSDLLANTAGTVTVTVDPVNDAPVITSTPVTAVNEDEPYIYNIIYSDVDPGDVVTLSSVVLPSWLQLNAGQGTLTGTPSNDQVGMDPTASFPVEIKVSDGNLDSTQTFDVVVTNVNDAPEILGQKDTLSVQPNNSVELQLSNIDVVDVDDQTGDLTLTILAGSDYTIAGNSVIVSSSVTAGYLPVNIQVSDPDNATDEGIYEVQIVLTGIEDMHHSTSLINKVYPSPAVDYVVFEMTPANDLTLQIFDITGTLLFEEAIGFNETKVQINTDVFNPGIYLYKVSASNEYQVGRFVISNQ